jgi:CheY-like chemotaxis protein
MNSSSNGAQSRHGGKPLIFVVDDEPLLLELASTLLAPLGYEIKTFRDAESAVVAYSEADPRPDLIVTDHSLHHMNGLQFIRECRRIDADQKILMVSGTVDETIYRHSPAKPDRFLAKPYQAKKFISVVQALLGVD